jgi:hypothetical protein
MKHYLNDLVCRLAPENCFAQDAIENAILSGLIKLTMDPVVDDRIVMDRYDEICERAHAKNESENMAVPMTAWEMLGRLAVGN